VDPLVTPVRRQTYVLQFHRPPDTTTDPGGAGSPGGVPGGAGGVPGAGGEPLTVARSLRVSTRLTGSGFDCSLEDLDAGTATLDLTFTTDQQGTLFFEWGSLAVGSSGPTLEFRSVGAGQLSPTPDGDGFSHGTVMYEVTGGTGVFEQARGFITSNFLVNLTTNELLDTHLGILRL
jgi:hypothetical protein